MPTLLLLPAQTAPADEALGRRHDPRGVAKDYSVFRECLRWEFGFTCAICLLHEQDILAYGGSEGWAVTAIEHLVPRSHDASLVGEYDNLLYICRLCNGARSDTDLQDDQGRRLLDPTRDVWARHFRLEGDELLPFDGDMHAEYTADVYAINDPRKVKLRRGRRERTCELAALIGLEHDELSRLTQRTNSGDTAAEQEIAQALSRIRDKLGHLYRLRLAIGGRWVPDDAPRTCRCGRHEARSLPAPYLRQVVELEVP